MKSFCIVFGLALLLVSYFTSALAITGWPAGDYLQSCKLCTFDDNKVLTCRCEKNNTLMQWSSMHVGPRCPRVQNIDGHLTCTTQAGRLSFPKARNVGAGRVLTRSQARRQCPRVCRENGRAWNERWWTVNKGIVQTVCQCVP